MRSGSVRWGWIGLCCASVALGAGGCAGTPPANAPTQEARLRDADRVFTPQRRGDWCWAACCEMALKYNGIDDITQEMLVEKYKGKAVDQTAIDGEIILALATEPAQRERATRPFPSTIRFDTSGLTRSIIGAGKIYSSSDSAVEDFRSGNPVLLGLKDWEGAPAHIVFITAIDYKDNRAAAPDQSPFSGMVRSVSDTFDTLAGGYRYTVVAIEFYDPMPETGGVTRLDGPALDEHFRFYLSRKRAREVVGNLNSTIQWR